MRQVVLDTETTGLEVRQGHRIIEIACIEMVERRLTGRKYQTYLNPDRAIDEGARKVTGIADDFLLDKPRFAEVAEEFLDFIDGAELVIHNAAFDVGFLNAELARLAHAPVALAQRCRILDTLAMARERYPGQRNSLDALCKRLGVDNSRRQMHGGLIDVYLLADVYIGMTSGQEAFTLGFDGSSDDNRGPLTAPVILARRPLVRCATSNEMEAHEARLNALDKAVPQGSIWRRLAAEA